MPKCPDCRNKGADTSGVELEEINVFVGEWSERPKYMNDEPYYKCPVCRQEFNMEDIEE